MPKPLTVHQAIPTIPADALVHLFDEFPYVTALCGVAMADVGEAWTDSIYEAIEVPEGYCPTCIERAKKVTARVDADDLGTSERRWEHRMLYGSDDA